MFAVDRVEDLALQASGYSGREPEHPQELVYDVWKKAGRFETDSQGGWPADIYGTRRL